MSIRSMSTLKTVCGWGPGVVPQKINTRHRSELILAGIISVANIQFSRQNFEGTGNFGKLSPPKNISATYSACARNGNSSPISVLTNAQRKKSRQASERKSSTQRYQDLLNIGIQTILVSGIQTNYFPPFNTSPDVNIAHTVSVTCRHALLARLK
jgi:hypothetical protein